MAGVIAASLGIGSGQVARAETGVTNDPLQASAVPPVGAVGVDPTTYAALFGGVPPDAPTGTIVADSGFRAFPNGFSFINYGADLAITRSSSVSRLRSQREARQQLPSDWIPHRCVVCSVMASEWGVVRARAS